MNSFCEPPPQGTSRSHQGQDWYYRLSQAICQMGRIVSKLASAPPSSGSVSITATNPIVVTPSPLTNTGVISHAASGVVAGTYGDASNVAQFTVEADGHITSAANVPIVSSTSFTLAYLFGDGRDGDFVLNGTNTYSQLSKVGNNYTCTEWLAAHNVTINANCTLHNGNFPIFIRGTLTNNGKIGAWGADAVNGAGGTGIPVQFFPLTLDGEIAALTGGNGTAFVAPTLSYGGGGGNGGAGNGTHGGTAGAVTPPGDAAGGLKSGAWVLYAMANTKTVSLSVPGISPLNECSGSGASGGGGADGIQSGGGGGAAAGFLFLAAFQLAGNGTISCAGGRGGNASGAGPAGAGGGGGGGCIWFCTTTPNPTTINTFTVAGGAHGTPVGTGGTGTDGTAGSQYIFVGS